MKNKLLLLVFLFLSAPALISQEKSSSGINKKFYNADEKVIHAAFSETNDWQKKTSPLLNMAYTRHKNELKKSSLNLASFRKINPLLSFVENENGEALIQVFIKSENIYSVKNLIKTLGGRTYTVAGNIFTAEIKLETLDEIASNKDIIFIEASTFRKELMDASRVEIKADQVHAGSGLPQSYRGDGVITGIIDSGIDWKHEDFKNSGGSKIQYLWDMSGSSNPPLGYNYGREYTKSNIDANQCYEVDGNDGGGHGTHVAATAAGSGSSNGSYLGIAPNSDIIFVKGFRDGPGFADGDVVNGCNYIFQNAQAAGKPAVINLSLGGHYGAHDGTSLYEQSLSNLTGQGKIIVAAAGNEGEDQVHLSYTTGGSSINEARQTIWKIFQGESISAVDMWYNSGSISVGVAAYDANLNYLGATNPVAPGQSFDDLLFTVGGVTYGKISIDARTTSDPNNGARRATILIDDGNGVYNLNAVWWVLYTFGSGTLDAWMITGGFFTTDSNPSAGIYPGDNNKSIGIPGTANKVICVGSYVTKNQWVDIDGNTWTQGGSPTVGSKSGFSSFGPSRDGRIKPDISAPGEVIVAALSSNLTISDEYTPRSFVVQGGKHQKMQGTSMASPHVTGVVSLMLQRDATLDYDRALNILKSTARKDGFTGASENNSFGSGKIDALAAVQNVSGSSGGIATLLEEGFENDFPPAGWQVVNTHATNNWRQGNPSNNNFNTIDPLSTFSAICQWIAEDQNEWLVSPVISLGNGAASVEFYAGHSSQWLNYATLKLWITTDGVNFQNLWTAENDGQSWIWRKKTIDLSGYKNQNIMLAWQYIGNDGDLVGLDAVKVEGFLPTSAENQNNNIPSQYELSQNYPNPFNPTTKIKYSIHANSQSFSSSPVLLKVYDILGREVAVLVNEPKAPGIYEITFNAGNLASGVYFYELRAGSFSSVKKLLLLR